MKEYTEWIAIMLRKVHIIYQAWLWSRTARKQIDLRNFDAAQIALDKFNQLNAML